MALSNGIRPEDMDGIGVEQPARAAGENAEVDPEVFRAAFAEASVQLEQAIRARVQRGKKGLPKKIRVAVDVVFAKNKKAAGRDVGD